MRKGQNKYEKKSWYILLLVPVVVVLYWMGFLCFFPGSDKVVSNILLAKDNSFEIKILREQECFNSFSDGTTRSATWSIVLKKENGEQVKKPLDRYLYFHLSSDIKSKKEIRYTLAWEEQDRVIGFEDTAGNSGKIFIFDDYIYFGNEFLYTDDLEKVPVDEQIQATLSATNLNENDLWRYSCVFVGSNTRSLDEKTVINNDPHVILVVEEDVFKGILSSGPIVINNVDNCELYITPEWIQINEGFNVYGFFEDAYLKHFYLSCNRIYLNDEVYRDFKMVENKLSSKIHCEVRKVDKYKGLEE